MTLRSIPPNTACKRSKDKELGIPGKDPVRFRTRRATTEGSSGPAGTQDTWKPSIQQTPSRKSLKTTGSIGDPPENPRRPEIERFEDKKQYQVIVDFPHHQENEIKVEIKGDILTIESTKTDLNYHEEILLPEDVLPEDYEQTFNNGVLSISFQKTKKDK